jgi:hypothetical protein
VNENEEETFAFMSKNKEEDNKGSFQSIEDFEYPLADASK